MVNKKQLFLKAIVQCRLAHAYALVGAKGVGKSRFVEWLIQTLFCTNPQQTGEACLQCDTCRKVQERNLLDLIEIRPDGQSIKVNQIRELKQQLAIRGAEHPQKVCVIYQADTMTTGASNSLLKLLEEPDMNVHFFLITEHVQALLPTIQSRCQIIYFHEQHKDRLVDQLIENGTTAPLAMLLVQLTNNVEQAEQLARDESFLERKQRSWTLFTRMFGDYSTAFVSVQTEIMNVLTNTEEAQQFLELVLLYYRDSMQLLVGNEAAVIQVDKLERYKTICSHSKLEQLIRHVEYLYEALQKVKANVGVQAIVEQWILRCSTTNY